MFHNRFTLAVFLGLILGLALAVLPQNIAYAISDNAVQSGSWDVPATWNSFSVPTGVESLTIPGGFTVDFSGYINSGTISNLGGVTNNGTFSNSGTVDNEGTITNTGTINNTGIIINNGIINTLCPASISGTILGNGIINYDCTTPVSPPCLTLTADSVVGAMPNATQADWSPGKVSPGLVINPGTYWVLGEDSSGKYYKILLSCQYLWVPVGSMQPSFQPPWSGQPLPTGVVS